MSKIKRLTSLIIVFVLVFSTAFCANFKVSAESNIGIITGESVALRSAPNTYSGTSVYERLSINTEVEILEKVSGNEAESGHGTVWYKVKHGSNVGYVYGYYIRFKTIIVDGDFETQISQFPESYKPYLRNLHAIYPNYKFIPDKLNMSFSDAVSAEYNGLCKMAPIGWPVYGDERWYSSQPQGFDKDGNRISVDGSGWYYASRSAIAYFMDPRNFLSGNDFYMFAQQGYDKSLHSADLLKSVIKGTFLENGYGNNSNAYINDIMEAANSSGVNPCVLAAIIIAEQGTKGTSSLISGTYPGFEGYYNFFNVGASGQGDEAVIRSGLTKAKEKGWNSRRAAILGGASVYSDGYIAVGQDTYYYKNFNLVKAPYYSHQYAGNLWDSKNNASQFAKAFTGNTSAALTFKIPVFTSISETVSPRPDQGGSSEPEKPTPTLKRGDINSDGAIDVVDLAAIKFHILGIKSISSSVYSAADVNKDGVVDVVDLAAIKFHILGIKTIS